MITLVFLDKAIFYLLICYALLSSVTIAGTSIVLALTVIVAVTRYIKQPTETVLDRGLLVAIAFFFCTILVSSITAYEPLTSFKQVLKYFYRMTPFFLAIMFIKTRQQLTVLMFALCTSICIADTYAIWQGMHGQQRVAAFSAHPMILAGYMIQMIPLLLVMSETDKIGLRQRAGVLVVLLMTLAALLYNGTRGAWIAVTITLFIYGIINIKRSKYILTGVVVLSLATGIIFWANPLLQHRIQSITDFNYQSNSERLLLWKSSWEMFKDYPLTGIGADHFEILYPNKYILPEAKEPELSHAHNNFIHMASETGSLGLTGFVYMFSYILRFSWRSWRLNPDNLWTIGCFLVTISLLLQGLTEFNFGNSAVMRLYWFIVGLMMASCNIYQAKLLQFPKTDNSDLSQGL